MVDPVGQSGKIIRRTVYFSGRVQGVGFRYTTEDLARNFKVTGFVRNLRDGRVEMVAEGEPNEVDHFQKAVEEAMAGYTREVNANESLGTGEFNSFTIAR